MSKKSEPLKRPLVLVGFDGGEWNLINPWIDRGFLPNIKKIKDAGVYTDMISTIPPVTGPALASFFTGLNPDNTGITSFIKPGGGVISYNDIKNPAMWDYLGAANIRSCIVGLRLTYPPKKINGIMLSGGLLRSEGDDFIQPEKYMDVAMGYHPDPESYPELFNTLVKGFVKDQREFTDELIRLTKKQFSIFVELRKKDKFLFSLLWVENTDLLQHFCWDHPEEILRLYQCLDNLMGEFLETNPDFNLVILSDHGFHATPDRSFSINGWLSERGYLQPARIPLWNFIKDAVRRNLSDRLSTYQKRKIRSFIGKIKKGKKNPQDSPAVFRKMPLTIAAANFGFRAELTTAFSPFTWGIYVNADAVGYEKVRSRLISDMESFTDEEGNPVFKLIYRKEDIYSGQFFQEMPDILFLVQDRFHVDINSHKKCFNSYHNKRKITGAHDQAYRGIAIAFGPDLKKETALNDIRIIDFFPTVLNYFGLSIPDGIDGKSRAAVFGYVEVSSKDSGDFQPDEYQESGAYSEEEEEKIKQRLKNLGYL